MVVFWHNLTSIYNINIFVVGILNNPFVIFDNLLVLKLFNNLAISVCATDY